jgi:hypothetical protein
MDLPKLWNKIDALLFPSIPGQYRTLSLWQYLLFASLGVVIFSFIGLFLPAAGFIGYDWVYNFSTGRRGLYLAYYPPWVVYLPYLTWPGLIGFTFTGLALALYQRRASPLVMAIAFLTFPVVWVVFLGQIEGVILFGLTGLPWLVPLATIKPQVSYLAFLARKEYLLALLVWLVISIVVWGLWPLDIIQISIFSSLGEPHDIHLWPWSLPVVIILLWLSRGDMDLLMLAGTFILPYLHPYHYFLVVPALARVEKNVAVLAAIVSWLPLLANWLGPWTWFLGHLFPLLLWAGIYAKRRTVLFTWQI